MKMQYWLIGSVLSILLGCVDSTKDDSGTPPSYGGDAFEGASSEDPGDLGEPDPTDDGGSDDTGDTSDTSDADGDGFSVADGDCDDTDMIIYPGAEEWCNDKDDDCDGIVDNVEGGVESSWYPDADGDGFGDQTVEPMVSSDCSPPEGYALAAEEGDCDDDSSTVSPAAVEQCDDIDNDCDDLIDEDDPDLVPPTWYPDGDGDGFGDDAASVDACEAPDDHIAIGGDPDDTDAEITGEDFWTERVVIELTWATEGDDMDLHLLAPDGELNSVTDCYFSNCKAGSTTLDWGTEGVTEDNPTLDVDDIAGIGPEVISIAEPSPGSYTIVVHDYPSSVMEEGNSVSIRILLDSELVHSDTRVIIGEDIYLAIAEIIVSDDEELTLTFSELDEELTPPEA
jgi:hypothetical protein